MKRDPQAVAFFTIVAKNYFALAKVLTASIRRAHPEADIYILLVDATEIASDYQLPGIEITTPYEVLDPDVFETMAYSYDVTELSTALKPFMLAYLLTLGYQAAVYLDPDIVVFQPLREVFDSLAVSNVVLTPHLTAPIPFDGRQPDEITILQAGTYNLGFIAVRNSYESRRFLDWWAERLKTMSVVDVGAGLFTDQKWVNLVPGMFSGVAILRSRGLNVAYWNLHERRIDRRDRFRLVTGEALGFFHFSGFNPRDPRKLSKYQDRVDVAREPGLSTLLEEYAQKLQDAGHAQFITAEYGFAQFPNGAPIDMFARRALRDGVKSGLRIRRPRSVDGGGGALFTWLNEPAVGTSRQSPPFFTNYLKAVYDLRTDLHRHFSDPGGRDRERFFKWLNIDRLHGAGAPYVRAAYVRDHQAPGPLVAAVNAIGYFRAESGTGEHARAHVAAIQKLGLPVNLIDVSPLTVSRQDDHTLDGTGDAVDGAINLVMVNADEVLNVRHFVGEHLFDDRYNIAFWAWELAEFPPEWHDRFAYFDEIWVGSNFVREAVLKHSPAPVIRVPLVITVPPETRPKRAEFGFADDTYVFLYIFDFLSVFARKNPLAAIAAFREAFPRNESVRLVLKFSNSDTDPQNRELLYAEAATDPRIELIDRYLSRTDKNALLASCDAYVSPHRAEGFGITMAEAMLLQKPVVATNWSGNVDFLNRRNGYPVAYTLTTIEYDLGPYKRGQQWADIDLIAMAAAMREVYEHPQDARRRAERAAKDVRSSLSAEAVSAIMGERLRRAMNLSVRRRATPVHA